MKKIHRFLLLILVLSIPYLIEYQSYVTGYNPWARFDLGRLCSQSEHILKDESDPIKRIGILFQDLNQGFYSPSAKNILNVLSIANSDQRVALFEQGMQEIGFPAYKCPAILQILK